VDPRRAGEAGDPWGELRVAATALELALPPRFEAQAREYLDALTRWERIGRLTGYATPALRVRHLLLESLMLLRAVPDPGTPLLDIGSGPGVPGLIVKLARPDWEVTLLESNRRRVNFLRDVIRRLALPDVQVSEGRAEALAAGELAGRFATATIRAVSGGEEAGALAAPFLRPDGVLVQTLGQAVDPPAGGRIREVTVRVVDGELPWRRRFLIIPRAVLEGSVSRGTPRVSRTHDRRRQPEGRRRQDDHRRQSR
jgi:16S rRNA (guanine527-N7)-methyltransferase